jgi:hypothetical protein
VPLLIHRDFGTLENNAPSRQMQALCRIWLTRFRHVVAQVKAGTFAGHDLHNQSSDLDSRCPSVSLQIKVGRLDLFRSRRTMSNFWKSLTA